MFKLVNNIRNGNLSVMRCHCLAILTEIGNSLVGKVMKKQALLLTLLEIRNGPRLCRKTDEI